MVKIRFGMCKRLIHWNAGSTCRKYSTQWICPKISFVNFEQLYRQIHKHLQYKINMI